MSVFTSSAYPNYLLFRKVAGLSIDQAWKDSGFAASLLADPKAAILKQFDYTSPFGFEFGVYANQATWKNDLKLWVMVELCTLKLILPPAPPESERDEALAAFKAMYPTFLGVTDQVTVPSPTLQAALSSLPEVAWMDIDPPTEASLLEFGQNFASAVDLAWKDADFKKALLTNPAQGIANYLHYVCPGSQTFVVKEAGSGYGWDAQTKRWNLPNNFITFGIPTAPGATEQAVALGNYLYCTDAYLFCCC